MGLQGFSVDFGVLGGLRRGLMGFGRVLGLLLAVLGRGNPPPLANQFDHFFVGISVAHRPKR